MLVWQSWRGRRRCAHGWLKFAADVETCEVRGVGCVVVGYGRVGGPPRCGLPCSTVSATRWTFPASVTPPANGQTAEMPFWCVLQATTCAPAGQLLPFPVSYMRGAGVAEVCVYSIPAPGLLGPLSMPSLSLPRGLIGCGLVVGVAPVPATSKRPGPCVCVRAFACTACAAARRCVHPNVHHVRLPGHRAGAGRATSGLRQQRNRLCGGLQLVPFHGGHLR
jgi:hypothetical protein